MERKILTTADGSKTIEVCEWQETYHSRNGALAESRHVFIENGLKLMDKPIINILEMGFGTGLNLLVTLEAILKMERPPEVNYYGIEKYPVKMDEIQVLNYPSLFNSNKITETALQMHTIDWEIEKQIYPNFNLTKINDDFFNLDQIDLPLIDLVYFDCFGARVQPELWEETIFMKLEPKMKNDALITTYSSKSSVRRLLLEMGFEVEKKIGPPGKREMMVARKKEHVEQDKDLKDLNICLNFT